MNISVLEDNDLAGIPSLQPPGWPDILPPFKMYLSQPFCYPLKIMDQSRLTGVGAAIIFHSTAWLGHIIVDEKCRGLGWGKLMTEHLVELCLKKSVTTISLIATDLGFPIYQKLQFVPETEYAYWQGTPREQHAFNGIYPASAADLPYLADLDQRMNAENRKPLLDLHANNIMIYKTDGLIRGAYWPELGEGLIVAEDEEAGIALTSWRGQHQQNASFPINNLAAMNYYEQAGYRFIRQAWRMYWGNPLDWSPTKLYHRIAGNLG